MVTGDEFDRIGFGSRLTRAAKRADLSQTKLAQAIDRPRSRVNDWIKGRRIPSVRDVIALSEALGVSMDYLLTGREPDTPARAVVDDLAGLAPSLLAVVSRAARLARE